VSSNHINSSKMEVNYSVNPREKNVKDDGILLALWMRKEQLHGANDARETTCRERGRPVVPPCPKEGELDHAAGVLCHHGVQPSLRSIPAPHLCEAGDPGRCDAGPPELFGPRRGVLPHEALSLAQTTEACGRPCRGRGARLGGAPCRGALRGGCRQRYRNSCVPHSSTWGLPPWTVC